MTADAGASPQTLWRGFPCEALAPRSPRDGPSLAGDYCHCTNETTLPNTFKLNDAVSASASASGQVTARPRGARPGKAGRSPQATAPSRAEAQPQHLVAGASSPAWRRPRFSSSDGKGRSYVPGDSLHMKEHFLVSGAGDEVGMNRKASLRAGDQNPWFGLNRKAGTPRR